jgi:hypothetical protein
MSLMLGKLLLWSLRKHFWDRIAIAKYRKFQLSSDRGILRTDDQSQMPRIFLDFNV